MPCPACGAVNPAGAKFCNDCAAPLTGTRPTPPAFTSHTPRPLSYTPRHLAEKILTFRSALEDERKQVTVLFADVKGSTEIASELDPEEWYRVMDRFFHILAEGVHRFERVSRRRDHRPALCAGAPLALVTANDLLVAPAAE